MGATINWGSINAKTNSCIKSGSGKKKADEFIAKAKSTGGVKTSKGDLIVGAKEMAEAANAMTSIMAKSTSSWPGSLAEAGASLGVDGGISPNPNGKSIVNLSFKAELSRLGLYDGAKNAMLYNVIAAWNNGWHAGRPVYGLDNNNRYKWSWTDYPGDHYLQRAVDEFNSTYGGKYNCRAILSPMYNGSGGNLKQFTSAYTTYGPWQNKNIGRGLWD